MRRAGFTLIEIMIVVGIIAVMLAGAVMSISSGRSGVKVKEATRGVVQLSRYASALALLRQRPVVVTFHHRGKVEVRISGESAGSGKKAVLADPIYLVVNGEPTQTAAELAAGDSDGPDAEPETSSADAEGEKKSLFFVRQPLDPDALAKEDADGVYEGVTFTVEVLGEDGEPLSAELAAARSLKRPERENPTADEHGGPDAKDGDEPEDDDVPPVSVTYETNGNVNPHRIIVRQQDAPESDEGFAISISRSGKASVGDDDEEGGEKRRNVRNRRR